MMRYDNSHIFDLAEMLSGRRPSIPTAASMDVPPYLEDKYSRGIAARQLGEFAASDKFAVASLFRAAIMDPEEDVRKLSILELFHAKYDGLDILFLMASSDVDNGVRRLGLEGLAAIKMAALASVYLQDPDPEISQLAQDVLSGNPISFYELKER